MRSQGWAWWAGAIAVLSVGSTVGLPTTAAAQSAPSVTVATGPTDRTYAGRECSDVVHPVDQADELVFSRAGDATASLTVDYDVGGSATPGEDYESLPGEVTFPAGAATVAQPIEVFRSHDYTRIVDVVVTLEPGPGYDVGTPSSATATFVVRRDPALPPKECGFGFENGEIQRQTIPVGGTPTPLVLVQMTAPSQTRVPPEDLIVRILSGGLPPGVALGQGGTFTGRATTEGAFTAMVEACRAAPPGTCVQAELTITVTGSPPHTTTTMGTRRLPDTGAGRGTARAGLWGATLVATGLLMVGAAARRTSRVA